SSGWRRSVWAVPFERNGKFLMKHTFSGEIVSLSADEYKDMENIEELRQHRFIVPTDYDEDAKYLETVKLIRLMQPQKPGLKSYTILPTTACNARCTYCYEEGFKVSSMTQETAEALVSYIEKTRHDDKVTLAWFGGEPLVGVKVIRYVCEELERRGIPFGSRMITNASLFTPELVKEAKEVWKLSKVQVSLDGDRRDYTERKRYIDPVKHNYEKVISVIHMLAEQDIKVNLRVNFDKDSIGRLKGFLDEMKAEFGDEKNVTLYLAALYQEKAKPYYLELQREMLELDRYIRELGINYENREKMHSSFKINACMADSLDKSVVIQPDGSFFDCEHLPEAHSWGNVFDGVTDKALFDKLAAPHKIDDMCKKCPYLPQCTPFYKNGCPGWCDKCRGVFDLKTEYELLNYSEQI
ncbi:MAG: radical SAM protein, partial [Ruminococcus sp.]|nr:radical SAM protein [Ruminococcus sp.]